MIVISCNKLQRSLLFIYLSNIKLFFIVKSDTIAIQFQLGKQQLYSFLYSYMYISFRYSLLMFSFLHKMDTQFNKCVSLFDMVILV